MSLSVVITLQRACDSCCFNAYLHIMNPNNLRAFEDGGRHGGQTTVEALFDWSRVASGVGENAADEGFS